MKRIELPKELEPLKNLKQFVIWRYETLPGRSKPTKPPYSPITGNRAESNNPESWGTFEQAAAALERDTTGTYQGIGIMFANGIYGVDLDHCLDSSGRIGNQTAADIVETANSYTEYSPSGTGVHVLLMTDNPGEGIRRHIADPLDGGADDVEAELYFKGRYFTITGRPYGTPQPIQKRTAQGNLIYAAIKQAGDAYTAKKQVQKQPTPAQSAPQPSQTSQIETSLSDREIMQKAFASARGAEISRLWRGDMSAHGDDHSAADMALIDHLAYWTNGDSSAMDRLFRQSGLMREKWDEIHGADTYGNITISKALANFRPYTRPAQISATAPTGNAATQQGNETEPAQKKPTEADPHPDSINRYLSVDIDVDIAGFQRFKNRKSGFYNLDEVAGALYPGLYVVGAISSLGKTTFIHQIADYLAMCGEHVLFFSLEQSRLEMVLKSVSRSTAQIVANGYRMSPSATGSLLRNADLKQLGAVPAITIRGGYSSDLIKQAREWYAQSVGDRMNVIECNFDITVESIREYVTQYIKVNDVRPVIVLDYLQIVPASDPRMDERRKTDHIIRGLKKLQADYDLLLFVVSSLNRSNYLAPIDFESFKESGGIEYTADVVWGLQLSTIHADIFSKDNKLKDKREMIQKAKAAIPRSIELVCLKNRYGVSSYTCNFDYDPRYDYFVPAVDIIT